MNHRSWEWKGENEGKGGLQIGGLLQIGFMMKEPSWPFLFGWGLSFLSAFYQQAASILEVDDEPTK